MHRIKIIFLYLLIGLCANAQTTGTSKNLDIKDKLLLRSGLYVPSGTSSAGLQGGFDYPGALYHETDDSSISVYNGASWYKFHAMWSGGANITNRNTGYVQLVNGLRVSSGSVGIGTLSPGVALDVSGETNNDAMGRFVMANNTQFDGPSVTFRRARGSIASQTVVTSGDILGFLRFQAYNGNEYTGSRASIHVSATQNWGVDTNGTRMQFSITPDNSGTLTEKARLNQYGLGINPFIGTNRNTVYANIDIADTASSPNMLRSTYFNNDIAEIPAFDFYRAEGDNVTPDTLSNNSYFGGIAGRGWSGTSFTSRRVGIYFRTSEAWTPSATGTEILFNITPKGSTTETNKMLLTNGYVQISDSLKINTVPTGSITDSVLTINTNAVYKVAKPLQTVFASTFNTTVAAGSTVYSSINGSPALNGTESARLSVFPVGSNGIIKNLSIALSSAQPGTGSLIVTIRKGSYSGGVLSMSDQSVTVTIPAGSAAGVYSDNVNSFTVSSEEILTIKYLNNASGASGTIAGVSCSLY